MYVLLYSTQCTACDPCTLTPYLARRASRMNNSGSVTAVKGHTVCGCVTVNEKQKLNLLLKGNNSEVIQTQANVMTSSSYKEPVK